jgi:glycosyltransferase involved in cell wall biosynthesis
MLTTSKPVLGNNQISNIPFALFLPECKNRKGEGGLRFKGYFKRSFQQKPLISVITVVFNSEHFLEQTIQSVLNQTYENVEYIIIDGGSTDRTLDIIRSYEDKIDYWVSEPDKGIYDAMNKGIDLATGEWVNFMNAGDRYYEAGCTSDIFHVDPKDAALIYGHCELRYGDFTRIIRVNPVSDLWKGMIFCHQSMFVKTSYMKKYKFNIENRIGADYEFICEMATHGHEFYNSNKIISSFAMYGVSTKNKLEAIKSHHRTSKIYFNKANKISVDIYYALRIISTHVKNFLKRILPQKLIEFLFLSKDRISLMQ